MLRTKQISRDFILTFFKPHVYIDTKSKNCRLLSFGVNVYLNEQIDISEYNNHNTLLTVVNILVIGNFPTITFYYL